MRNTPRALRAMAVSPHHLASQAALNVLAEGGDAVEAVVAASAVLCVAYPHMTGLGGDGFWLIHRPGRPVLAIDACGGAAGLATPDFYRNAGRAAIPWRGPLAALTVAGAVSGWELALADASLCARRDSRSPLPLARLLEEAAHHARSGVAVTAHQAALTRASLPDLADQPGFARAFLPNGRPLSESALQKRADLAATFDRLAQAGLDDFYRGDLAQDIAADLEAAGSPLRAGDLAAHRARAVEPLRLTLPGVEVFNLPAPTQGLASLLILGLYERKKAERADSFEHLHTLLEATKAAFAVRDRVIGDPDLTVDNPRDFLNSKALDALAANMDPNRAAPWPGKRPEGGDTVWLGAADGRGTVVSCIQSVFFEFGAGIVLPSTGLTWQNRGIAFELEGRGPRVLAPGRKPYHTLNPALARFDDGRVMAYGTMGGEGQPQTQAAVFTRYAMYGQGLQQAVTAPRWVQGRTWGSVDASLRMENRFAPEVVEALRLAGHEVELVGDFDSVMGHAGAVVRRADGLLEGATDPRSDGQVCCR